MTKKKSKGAKLQNKKRYKESKEISLARRQFYQWCWDNGKLPIETITRDELKRMFGIED